MSSSRSYKIPIVDLHAQYRQIRTEVRSAINEVLDTQQFILGPAVQRFEQEMAAYLQCDCAVGVASGSDALLLALMALEIRPGDAVIVPPFTFFSTVSAITRLGATPIFIDINCEDFLLSITEAATFLDERAHVQDDHIVDSKTGLRIKALLLVHLFGRCCPMPDWLALAKNYSLRIVEDVAQACGARTSVAGQARFAGTVGDLGCFSFFPSKTLGGYGDGGLVGTHQPELAERLKVLRMHGESTKYYHQVAGINSRLDSIQAAVLSVKLRYLEKWCEQRIERAKMYHELFSQSALMGAEVISIPAPTADKSHVFNNYVIRVQRRDDLRAFLAKQGIQSEVYYPLPLHLQACFASIGHTSGDFPQAELAARQVLALPLHPELRAEQQESVVKEIRDFFRH